MNSAVSNSPHISWYFGDAGPMTGVNTQIWPLFMAAMMAERVVAGVSR